MRSTPWHAICLFLLLMVGIGTVTPGLVALANADYLINVAQQGINIQISGEIRQGVPSGIANATTYPFGHFPLFEGHLSGENASFLNKLLADAIGARTAGAHVPSVSFYAVSNETLMSYSLNFTVDNISTERSGIERVDVAWRSFAFKDDFGLGTVSINKIFSTYLEQGVLAVAQQQLGGGLQRELLLYVNGRLFPRGQAYAVTNNLLLFNFSSLRVPLERWGASSGLGSSRLLQSNTGYNVTFVEKTTDQGEVSYVIGNAVYDLSVVMKTPAFSYASGNQVTFETGGVNSTYAVMLIVVFACLGVFVSTLVLDRRLQMKRPPQRRK